MKDLTVGIDVGGTFTDLVLLSSEGEKYLTFKSPSTPENPSLGVLNVLEKTAAFMKMSLPNFLAKVRFFVHGTTVATNAMVQGEGPKVGLITTEGFRDVLEIRCGRIGATQAAMWDITARPQPPLVPRYLRIGVRERIDSEGGVVTELNRDDVDRTIKFFKEESVESIAVSLLFSFANPKHEQQIKEMIDQEDGIWSVSLSSDVSPTMKEYERTSSTVVNAFVQPTVSSYLTDLEEHLRTNGMTANLMVTQSNGGLMDVAYASRMSINTLLSGPAAGVTGATFFGELIASSNLVLMDMGGTSFDVSMIKNGQPILHDFTDIGGHYIQTPSIDIHTIGTGGGSIAHVDSGGILHVGPQSAGADPGPACYGKGGTEPTVTDAYLALGLINPAFFLGGEMPLVEGKAREVISERIAKPLGLSLEQAAAGIVKVSNQQMADAIRRISFEKGEDIRDYGLVAAGGAGSLCASMIAQDLGINRTLSPRLAPVFCAMGMLVADLRHDFVRSYITRLGDLDFDKARGIFSELESLGREILLSEGVESDSMRLTRSVEMRYHLQIFEIEVPLEEDLTEDADLTALGQRFNARHKELYGFDKSLDGIEVVNLRVVAIGQTGNVMSQSDFGGVHDESNSVEVEPIMVRSAYFPNPGEYFDTPVFRGEDLGSGFVAKGPVIVEEVATTVIVAPGQTLSVDSWGNFVTMRNKDN